MPTPPNDHYPWALAVGPVLGVVPAFLVVPVEYWLFVLALGAGVGAWALALWRAARPDLLGVLATGVALTPPLVGAYQIAGGALTVNAAVWGTAASLGVGVLRWLWHYQVGAFREGANVLEDLRGIDQDTVEAMVWFVTRGEVQGRADDSLVDRDRLVDLLRAAGGHPTCAVTDNNGPFTEVVHSAVNGVAVRVTIGRPRVQPEPEQLL